MNRFRVRRATVEDLPQLRPLWQMENLPLQTLEKRFTEFQVAENEAGELVAAVGLQIAGGQGRLHSEAIGWFDLAEELRGQMWPRLESVARNQGLSRLWTSLEASFWKSVGFKKVTEATASLLPDAFREENAAWLTLPLRSTEASTDEVEKQMAVLKAMSQSENERLMDRARIMKWVAMGLMTAVFGAFAIWVVSWVWLRTRMKKQQNREL